MKRLATLALIGASVLGLAACNTSAQQIDPNRVIVADDDGGVDTRQISEACAAMGKQVAGWTKMSLDLGDGEALLVTCR